MAARGRSAGFTLVELLVALFAMALLAVMSWRGLDGMTRAQEQTQARADDVLTLQVGLAQWAADLDALIQLPQTSALDWNGRVLRITRRSSVAPGEGVVVAAWSRRDVEGRGIWLRWESAPATTREQLERAWQQADMWSQNPGEEERRREVAVTPLAQWQIFYFRGGAWSHPLSSDATAGAPALPASAPALPLTVLPDGVRLVLTLPPGPSISGVLTRDWVRPTLGGGKSS
ncbi:MAG TPA: prepilin-type N-terminal cleavage/methylation domain-containing protein [Ramlibacter sp.]